MTDSDYGCPDEFNAAIAAIEFDDEPSLSPKWRCWMKATLMAIVMVFVVAACWANGEEVSC